MAVYAIGDVQGCHDELRALLRQLAFNADRDRLWFVGDLVNRGPHSLAVLRFVRDLGANAVTVLGNHDLHLLAVASDTRKPNPKDTLHEVLEASDREQLVDWLRTRPLLHEDAELGYVLIHAGLAPQWDIATAAACAVEVEAVLRSPAYRDFLGKMYGDRPDLWSDGLAGSDRLRFILNCFTRLRMCDAAGRLFLREKGGPWGRSDGLLPWFDVPGRASTGSNIVFGHWSLLGRHEAPGIIALDTGCIWGGELSAVRLDAAPVEWHSIPCPGHCRPGD